MRPRQTFQTLRQCFISSATDFDWCRIIDPEQCETECTSSKTRPIPKHTKQSEKKMMNIEKKHLNRFQFHSKMNSCCLKWCQICKSSWICEQFEPTHEKIFAKMIFWKQDTNQKYNHKWFIKRIEIRCQKRLHTASNQYETEFILNFLNLRLETTQEFELSIITTSKLNDESVCQR